MSQGDLFHKAFDQTKLLIDAYAEELLLNPPVQVVRPGVPGREETARRLATKDVSRFLRAVSRAGFLLSLEKRAKEEMDDAKR